MKVYVIAWYYHYEGYGEPKEAYSTQEAAEEAIKKYSRDSCGPEIFELEVQE